MCFVLTATSYGALRYLLGSGISRDAAVFHMSSMTTVMGFFWRSFYESAWNGTYSGTPSRSDQSDEKSREFDGQAGRTNIG